MCGKAVITCSDSGGPSELVRDGETGFVTKPTPESLAEAMRKLMDDRTLAQRMGEAGHGVASQMTWPRAIQQLLR
jgi:glycosyltransferase involved in cell wall biosynthesis